MSSAGFMVRVTIVVPDLVGAFIVVEFSFSTVWRLAVESGTGGDSRAGGDEQHAGVRWEFFGRALECGHQRGGMHSLVVCDGDPVDRYTEVGGQCSAVSVPGRSGDDHVDVGKVECGLLEAAAGHLSAGRGELFVHRGRLRESKYISRVFESDCGTEVLTVVGDVCPVDTAEP